jgi:hypothetical protein
MKVLCLIHYKTWQPRFARYDHFDDAIMIEVSSDSEILLAYSHAITRYLAHMRRHRWLADTPHPKDVELRGYLPECEKPHFVAEGPCQKAS